MCMGVLLGALSLLQEPLEENGVDAPESSPYRVIAVDDDNDGVNDDDDGDYDIDVDVVADTDDDRDGGEVVITFAHFPEI